MFIESIELKNYRNYGELHMDFDPGTNVLYGDNAQGKTNILEAVYVCATTKSHRGSKDREIIEFGEDESHIKMQLRKDDVPYRIDMHLKKNKTKGVAVNGIPIRRASWPDCALQRSCWNARTCCSWTSLPTIWTSTPART